MTAPVLLNFFNIALAMLWSSVVPCKFQDYFFCFYERYHWNFYRISLNVQIALGRTGILTVSVLLAHEQEISFHLFVSSLICFINVLQFSVCRSFISLVKFIHLLFLIVFWWHLLLLEIDPYTKTCCTSIHEH